MKLNTIYNEDCLEGMKRIPDKSIDMILCDLPYGTTKCLWDIIIPFQPLWEQYERVIKDNGAIVLTGSQPFTSKLISSNIELFRYEWIWDKKNPTNFPLARKQPLKYHENILVFYKQQPVYNPQKWSGPPNHKQGNAKSDHVTEVFNKTKRTDDDLSGEKFPRSIIEIGKHSSQLGLHPTQKPVALFEYLIKTYTNKGDLVLDNCMGSGTTAVACLNTERQFIGFETNNKYYEKSLERIENNVTQIDLFG
ncbi:site-specific DNA-methyltransferase (adenine-specific) [Enterococcus sp. DIV0182]|uniref:DNA-methyltransferase n=1 Tax=unclassified Enterococcus TaxID=2608891 RepID=UPI000B70E137|nr:site-specific DNA-methyltransferase [Enterococcus sp. 5B7_DIV0075]OTP23839.1 hypothetical protein A5800_001696 [Enterococcus sp. 5B7_DIV0075]